jgi:ABC-type branched-subunit amino acid transport system permease subunit
VVLLSSQGVATGSHPSTLEDPVTRSDLEWTVLRPLADYRLVFYGVALTFVALFMPRGLHQIFTWASERFHALKGRAG